MLAASLATALLLAAPAPHARAVLRDGKGDEVGKAELRAEEHGVELSVEVHGLSPGKHGIHVHAVGVCQGPDFTTAGPHFNPTGKKHGLASPEGHHLGDLVNLEVGADGKGKLHAVLHGATLDAGPGGLLGTAGTAVVIHGQADDEKTDPAGNSGPRIACGVISAGP
jgi:superoxide dismutase, Cu-Zn family